MPSAQHALAQARRSHAVDDVVRLLESGDRGALTAYLHELHPADLAIVLESLPRDERLWVWNEVDPALDGEILLEVSDAVREDLIRNMDSRELLAATENLDTDEIADLAPDLPQHVMDDLLRSLDAQNRARLQSTLSYPEDRVGALMDYDVVAIRADVSLEVVLRYLRMRGELPDQTDKLFVVDEANIIHGVLPLKRLLLHEPHQLVSSLMSADVVTFGPEDDAGAAAQAFERYDLITAPVVDHERKLIGRLTVNTVMDFVREESESEILNLAGLHEEEDLFAPVWKSGRNRWLWLAINLVTAFVSSRVIGLFEGTIVQLVALATLMPIVASIGGNTGNQTSTLIVRAMAVGQLPPASIGRLLFKEIMVSLMNGVVWGGLVAFFAYALYHKLSLSLILMAAMILNLIVAAVAGVFIPLLLRKLKRDPALGSSVLLTATTDSMGFFIFLGLATVFLL